MSLDDSGSGGGGSSSVAAGGLARNMNPAVAELRAALVNEKCAPELLPRAAVADELATLLANQQQLVDEMAAKGGGGGGGGAGAGVALSLYQQDIERVRFLVASYARVRLRKVRLLPRTGRARARAQDARAAPPPRLPSPPPARAPRRRSSSSIFTSGTPTTSRRGCRPRSSRCWGGL
jgi:hypothetical protein